MSPCMIRSRTNSYLAMDRARSRSGLMMKNEIVSAMSSFGSLRWAYADTNSAVLVVDQPLSASGSSYQPPSSIQSSLSRSSNRCDHMKCAFSWMISRCM